MQNKIVLITGATSGIGKAAAFALAGMGARVGIVGRNRSKTEATAAEISASISGAQIDTFIADLSLMRDVRALAEAVKAKYAKLDVLLNNAGELIMQRQETAEGLEMNFALNYLQYFLLTNLLLDTVQASPAGRIVNVSSMSHAFVSPNFDDLAAKQNYRSIISYSRNKLMIIMFTYELNRRLRAAGSNVTCNCLHPGFVRTHIWKPKPNLLVKLNMRIGSLFASSPEQGAQTSIYLASSPEVEGISGKYFVRSKTKQSSKASYDETAQKRLWQISESLSLL
jgi:retinol dehydrogenase 14